MSAQDPEVECLERFVEAAKSLDGETQRRAVWYLFDRFVADHARAALALGKAFDSPGPRGSVLR